MLTGRPWAVPGQNARMHLAALSEAQLVENATRRMIAMGRNPTAVNIWPVPGSGRSRLHLIERIWRCLARVRP